MSDSMEPQTTVLPGSDRGAPNSTSSAPQRGPTKPADLVTVVLPRGHRLSLELDVLWRYRDLLMLLVWRDISARYRQSIIGYAWAFLKPVLQTLTFTLVFGVIARIDSGSTPYALFSLLGQLIWMYFSNALASVTTSVVNSAHMLTKVFFPRLILPLAAVLTGLVELSIQLVLVVAMLLWYQVTPTWFLLLVPVFIGLATCAALGFGLWLTALNVKYRDVGMAVPFFLSMWMFACPVVYPFDRVPSGWRMVYALNPMATFTEGFRWAFVGTTALDWQSLLVSCTVTAAVMISGMYFFRRTESTFADVV